MKRRPSIISSLIPVFVLIGIVILWEIISVTGLVPGYMLPSPVSVAKAFISELPRFAEHGKVTVIETFAGLLIGVLLGFIMAAVMDAFPLVRQGVYPLLVISQTIPTIAIAPLLILWFSYGMMPKIILVVLASFFPIAVGLLDGFRSVDPDLIRLMRSMKASKWQIFWHVKFPSALNEFFSGLKIAVSYSVVSAVVSEWLGGTVGLGVYMTRVKKSYAYDKMFAVIMVISCLSLLMIAVVNLIQYRAMPWRRVRQSGNR